MRRLLRLAAERGTTVHVPSGALAQSRRGGPRQAVLGAFLKRDHVRVHPLDEMAARAAGELCARRGTSDVVDAQVALCATATGSVLVTSDSAELRHLAPTVVIEPI